MKNSAILFLVVALGLMSVQSLQADTISYTIQEDFVKVPGDTKDPWGIGSGAGTAVFQFTLSSSPNREKPFLGGDRAFYLSGSPTLTLSGTTGDGVYTNPLFNEIVLANSFNLTDEFSSLFYFPIAGKTYTFGFSMKLPQSFWGNDLNPPLPKLLSQTDVMSLLYGEIRDAADFRKDIYTFKNITVTSQVVPIPPTVWLLASGLAGLAALRRRWRN
jgi:hypothetical protein